MDFNEATEIRNESKHMNIVQLNANINYTSVPYRLKKVFDGCGLRTKIVTMDSRVEDKDVIVAKQTFAFRLLRKLDYILLSLTARFKYTMQEGMPFSYYHVGMNICRYIKSADIVIIHWTGATFLSMHGIRKILGMHKYVIFVCHDNWHFTGGCHVRMGCEKYKQFCGCCPQLGSHRLKDWSYRLCRKKAKVYLNQVFMVVSPSSWMDNNVKNSTVFTGKKHYIIPNPIDTAIYSLKGERELRTQLGISSETKVLAFGAVNADVTPYKGYKQLWEALQIFNSEYWDGNELAILIFGSKEKKTIVENGIKTYYLGYLTEQEMVLMYNAADVYLVPSLEDSFNNTVAESMACETPVVAFATGGITDIIEHKINGYLAQYNNPAEFAYGLNWIMNNNIENCMGIAARNRIETLFSDENVGQAYMKLFAEILEKRNE